MSERYSTLCPASRQARQPLAKVRYRRHGFVPVGVVENEGGPPELQMACARTSGGR